MKIKTAKMSYDKVLMNHSSFINLKIAVRLLCTRPFHIVCTTDVFVGKGLLMYPEASYSFDGMQTPLPESLGKCLKSLKVPEVMIRTYGAFVKKSAVLYDGKY